MNTTTKNSTNWLQYGLTAALLLILFFTDLGTTVRGRLQQLLLKTGVKNAPTSGTSVVRSGQATSGDYPYALMMTTLDGRLLELSSLRGKVVFLNQWASWCPPCRAEMPAIEKLYQSVDKNKVAFVLLSLDENPRKARQFMQQKGFTTPAYLPAGPLPDAFASQAIPTTLVLDQSGRLVQRIEGMANYDTDEFRQYLMGLYKSSAH